MDVDSLQIAVSVQQQLCYLHTARECSPVKANVFFLNEDNPNKPTISQHLILLQRISNLGWRDFYANLVPDAAVSSFSKKQLHLVCMFVLCGPDHGRPASVILWKINNGLENQLKKYWNNINPTTYWNSYLKKKTKTTTTKKKSTAFNFQSSWVQSSNKGKAASLRQSCPDATYSKFIHLNPRHMQQSAARHASIIPREPFKPSYKVLYSKNTHWKSILVCHMNGKQVNQWIFIFFNGSYRSYETYYSLLSFESNNF